MHKPLDTIQDMMDEIKQLKDYIAKIKEYVATEANDEKIYGARLALIRTLDAIDKIMKEK